MMKNGMTLQELLISIALIGILSAIVAPKVVNQLPSKNKINLLKVNNTITNLVSNLLDDPSIYEDGKLDTAKPLDDKLKDAMQEITIVDKAHKLAYLFSDKMNKKSDLSSNQEAGTYSFDTTDGITWIFSLASAGSGDVKITVDVNQEGGSAENTNAAYNSSSLSDKEKGIPDTFDFIIKEDGNVEPDVCALAFIKNPSKLKKDDVIKEYKTVKPKPKEN